MFDRSRASSPGRFAATFAAAAATQDLESVDRMPAAAAAEGAAVRQRRWAAGIVLPTANDIGIRELWELVAAGAKLAR